jgi:adenylate cyclase
VERKLAAILAADVVRYSRLMEADEAGTFDRLRAHRKELFEPEIAKHHGRIFKLMGDGLLAEFGSVVDAVECAVAVQRGLAERNADMTADQRIEMRIGINLGDVIVEGEDRHGEGVNIAARLQELAEPGGIAVSQTVVNHVGNKAALQFAPFGEQHVKNISRPVRVFRVRLDGVGEARTPVLALPDKPSIAVLPFVNMSGDPEQEYFSDGITEDVISALARIHWLFVIARNSSFTYKGKALDVRQVSRELGVRYLIEGSVRKAGDRIRIASQLIDANTGTHIWADHLDGTLGDIFDLQDRITASIVGAIEPKLRHAEIARARSKPTESVDAYDLFLRAVALNTTRKQDDNKEALRLLYRATEIDKHYGAAYALAGYCCLRQRSQGWVSFTDPVIAEGIRMARAGC